MSAPSPVDHALAAYGTLQPGESNFAVVADIDGEWVAATVRGHLGTRRTGHYAGFPAFVPDPDGPAVPVTVLVSPALPDHWARIDAFEGQGYQRVEIDVDLPSGDRLQAWVYESVNDR